MGTESNVGWKYIKASMSIGLIDMAKAVDKFLDSFPLLNLPYRLIKMFASLGKVLYDGMIGLTKMVVILEVPEVEQVIFNDYIRN